MFISKKRWEELTARIEKIERHLSNESSFMVVSDGKIIRDPGGIFHKSSFVSSLGEDGPPVDNITIMEALIKKTKLKANPKDFKKGMIKLD